MRACRVCRLGSAKPLLCCHALMNRTPRRFPVLFLALGLLVTPGCYRYLPAGLSPPGLGTRIRVHLTEIGTTELSGYLGPRIAAVDGHLVALTDTSYVLSVTGVVSETGAEEFWANERAELTRSAVARVEQRRLDRTRTTLTSAALAGLVVGAVVAGNGGFGGGSPGGGRPGPR